MLARLSKPLVALLAGLLVAEALLRLAGFEPWRPVHADIVVTPGSGYGESGEGYIRLSLTIDDERMEEGLARLEGWKIPPPSA